VLRRSERQALIRDRISRRRVRRGRSHTTAGSWPIAVADRTRCDSLAKREQGVQRIPEPQAEGYA
jgi:hypothetical protein